MYKAVDVYFEKRKSRHYVGRLTRQGKKFVFEYDDRYRYSERPLELGPDISIVKKRHTSKTLFPTFADRIPLRENPAYPDYCKDVGISPDEKDPIVLLSTLGQKGPSSFVLAPAPAEPSFGAEDLKKFRKDLKLSIRDFALLFDLSAASVYRVENKKSSGKSVLKKIELYYNSPRNGLLALKERGALLHEKKTDYLIEFFHKSK